MRSIFHLLTLLVSSQAGLLPADLPKNGDKDFETALNSFDTPKDVTTIEMEVLTQVLTILCELLSVVLVSIGLRDNPGRSNCSEKTFADKQRRLM